MRFEAVRERLARLPEPLPPPPAELVPVVVAGSRAMPWRDPGKVRPAAVLVLIVPGSDGEAGVVLTERVAGGRYHSGEVSFPGGSVESDDADPAATALREAAEEIGLDADGAGVTVVGTLEPFRIPVSGFRVTPVLALADREPAFVAAPDEVARILVAPIAAFMPGATLETHERSRDGWTIRFGAYPVEDLVVWGATARILGQLGAVLGGDDRQ